MTFLLAVALILILVGAWLLVYALYQPESFQAHYRSIGGPNVFLRPWATGATVRYWGSALRPAGAKAAAPAIWGQTSMPVAPAFAATFAREESHKHCPKGLGWACPCPKTATEDQLFGALGSEQQETIAEAAGQN